MPVEDRMTSDERRKYLRKMQERYLQASRKERGRLLDEMEIVAQTIAVNLLYDKMGVYYNLVQPVMRLSEKKSLHEEGLLSRVKRRFDRTATPFEGLCATKEISPEDKERLEALRDQTNPRQLAWGL